MGYEQLTVAVPGGEIFATRRGSGPAGDLPARRPGGRGGSLIGLVKELDGLVNGVLPQQRGLYPSTLEGPRDVETHVADEIALLDQLGWEKAWLIGHAWGGHLAMHIAVAHPERVTGSSSSRRSARSRTAAARSSRRMVARLTPDERVASMPWSRARPKATTTRPSWPRC